MLEQIGEIHTDLRGSFTDCFLLMTGLAMSSVLAVLLFHRPDRDRESPAGAIA